MRSCIGSLIIVSGLAGAAHAQTGQPPHRHDASHHGGRTDASYAAMQQRGRQAMGVDQYTAVHVFDALSDGGRIELQRPQADSAEVQVIRAHLEDIAGLFATGDFRIPGLVHDGAVPGTETLAARRDRIRYEVRPLPKGGEVRITTRDATALAALRDFMAFQRKEHRADGRQR